MKPCQRVSCLLVVVNLLAVVSGSGGISLVPSVQAQIFGIPGTDRPDESKDEGQSLSRDRRVEAKLEQLSAAARKNDTTALLEHLEVLRTADPNLVVPESSNVYVPLHRSLTRRLQGFDAEMRDAVEQADPGADKELRKAIESGSPAELLRFQQRFAGTKAAGKAHVLLASMHADRGHTVAAQYWLAPMLASNGDPELRVIAEKLSAKLLPSPATTQGDSKQPEAVNPAVGTMEDSEDPTPDTPSTKASPAVKDENPTSRTSTVGVPSAVTQPNSSGETSAESPTVESSVNVGQRYIQERHWYKSLPISAAARTRSQQLLRESPQLNAIPWSAWQPELDTEFVYVRAPGLISAYRLSSGQHVWTRTLTQEQSPVRTVEPEFPGGRLLLDRDPVREALNSPEILLLHRNERMGRMTSDDDRLYLVSQISQSNGPSLSRGVFRLRGVSEQFSAGLWELIAIDKRTGRRLWTMGGIPVEEKFGNELAMAWLAGPPAVDRGCLYQVVERDSIVQMVCMEAATGQVHWQIPLAYPETSIGLDVSRQLLAAQTTSKGGLVYTTSTTGWFFAIDTLTRSVIWARKIATNLPESQRDRMFRNSGMFVPDLAPLETVWRSRPPIVVEESLLVSTAESGKLMCLDARSGKTRTSLASASGCTLILHCDQERLVVASPEKIESFALPKLKRSWTLNLPDGTAPPVGPGSLQENDLYVPLADGSAAVVLITNGTLKQTLKRFRPAWSSGGLYSAQGKILSHAPDHLTLLSAEPAGGHDDTDPLQHAMFLFESGDLKEASQEVAKIPVTALRRDTLRRLRFRIAVAMLKSENTSATGQSDASKEGNSSENMAADLIAQEAAQLEKIADLAQTSEEIALTHFLRLDFLLRTAPENFVPSLIDALTLDESVLIVDIPVTSNIRELLKDASGSEPLSRNPLQATGDHRFVTFRAWVLKQLRDYIAQANDEQRDTIIRELAAVPDSMILELHSRDLAEESLRRAEVYLQSGKCPEVALQLLVSAAEAQLEPGAEHDEQKRKNAARIAADFQKAREVLLNGGKAGTALQELSQRLITTVQYELQSKQPGMDLVPAKSVREVLQDRVTDAPELPFTMLPVSNNGRVMGRMSGKTDIDLYSLSDPVLSAFRWTARTVPSSIQATSVLNPLEPAWGLSQVLQENPNNVKNHELYRFGTILVLADSQGLSAFSVADQRWLWRKATGDGLMGRRAGLREQTFSPIENGIRLAIVNLNNFSMGISGGSYRWICLRTDDSIEVLDLYSGHRLWAMPKEDTYGTIIACPNGIYCHKGYRDARSLNPIDGTENTSIPASIESLTAVDIMRGTSNAVVTLRRSLLATSNSLEWVDPGTGKLLQSAVLPKKSCAFLPDSETMAILSESGELKVIDLMTGDQKDFGNVREAIGNALPTDPTKLGFHCDMLNCYLYEADENGPGQFSFAAYRSIPVKTAVVALNRSTGKLAWVRPLTGSGSLYVEGSEEVVVLAEASAKMAANGGGQPILNIPGFGIPAGQVYVLHGLSRLTGLSRFAYKVSAQRPFPEIRLTKTTANQLDLEAFGTRVRFLSTPIVATP